MASRQLHPREEPYRWIIEKLDDAFGQAQVRVTPRNHYHVIKVSVATTEGRSDDLILRDPTTDLNRREDRELFVKGWIAKTRKSFAHREKPVLVGRSSAA